MLSPAFREVPKLPFRSSIVLGLRSRKKLSAQVGRTEIINVRVGERHRFKASLKASSLATARSIASLAQSINSCWGSSSHDVSVNGLLMCTSALIFAACKKAIQVANSSGIDGLLSWSYCFIVGIVLFSVSCSHCCSNHQRG